MVRKLVSTYENLQKKKKKRVLPSLKLVPCARKTTNHKTIYLCNIHTLKFLDKDPQYLHMPPHFSYGGKWVIGNGL